MVTCLQLLPHGSLIVHHPAYYKKSEVVLAQLPAAAAIERIPSHIRLAMNRLRVE